jgi:hypothetical protein
VQHAEFLAFALIGDRNDCEGIQTELETSD